MKAFYLIPTTYISDGTLPIDYRAEVRKVDRRTRFTKIHAKHEIAADTAVMYAERMGLRIFRGFNGEVTRILAPDAKTARAYFNELKKHNYYEARG